MAEDWHPPRAPLHPPDTALPRRPARPAVRRREPGPLPRPMASVALAVSTASVFSLLFTAGAAFLVGGLLAGLGLHLGKRTERRSAIVLSRFGLGFALVAAIAWTVLAAYGVTPADLAGTR